MSIDLRLLRHARALSEHGSFRRAAESLKIAQPSLSRGIKELEAQVGLPLFVRSRTGHVPTDFGRVFLQHAMGLLAGADDLDREIELAKGHATGEIAVGMGAYVAEMLGPRCAARFLAKHPAVRLRIEMGDPAKVFRSLRAGTYDLAVGEQSVVGAEDDLVSIAKMTPIPGYIVVRAGHPLTRKAGLDLSDVMDYAFAQVVMLPPRVLKPILASRRVLSAKTGKPALPFPAIECPSPQLAVRIVAQSDAFTLASLEMVRNELELGQVVPVFQAPWLRTEWHLVRMRNRRLTPAAKAFTDALRKTHAEVLRVEAKLRERWFRGSDVGF